MLTIPAFSCAQEQALTAGGKAVLLHADGTWEYLAADAAGKIPTIQQASQRSADATARFDIPGSKYQLYFDPRKWRHFGSEPGRTTFQHADGDGYGVIITRSTPAWVGETENIALMRATSANPAAEILREETRIVNGAKLLFMQFKGTMEGVPFVYLGSHYSGMDGSVQIVAFTAANFFGKYEADFEEFLHGFVAGN